MIPQDSWPDHITGLVALINHALQEDMGDGDHTSLATVPASRLGQARLLVKEDGILAGMEAAREVFRQVDPELRVEKQCDDGARIRKGDIAFTLHGPVRSILGAERLALNILQRMSGIATYTNFLLGLIQGTRAKLLDTRKTTPGFRILEKEAVRIGGGMNHRFGLYDMILSKDHHVDAAGGIVPAIEAVQAYLKRKEMSLQVEIEVRNLQELDLVLQHGGVNRIMLDNFAPEPLRDAVRIIGGRFETEASGGITEATIREVALSGVDFISVGALTHRIHSLDLSLKLF